MRRRRTYRSAITALLGLAALVLAACSSGGATSTDGAKSGSGPFRIVLSNNFLGNGFRPEVEQIARLTADLPPFKGKIQISIVNSDNTNEAQIQSVENIIESKPSALLIDPGSSTALNPVVEQACKAGIVVVDYDQPLTAPCAHRVLENYNEVLPVAGEWMAKQLGGKGQIFVDQGLAGAPSSAQIAQAFLQGVRKEGPKISVAGTFYSGYNEAQDEQGVDGLLVAHPNVDGVMNQGYCTGGFAALKAEGKPDVPSVCFSYMSELVSCATSGRQCAVVANEPDIVQVAMKLALDVLEHKSAPPASQVVPVPLVLYVTDKDQFDPSVPGVTIEQIKLGVNAFPSLPPDLGTPWTLPGYQITAQQAAG
jgi:ribose transport system substrate-binding protein